MFCDTCGIVICSSCVSFGSHRGHRYRSVHEVAAKKRAELNKMRGTLDVYRKVLAASIMHIDKSEADNNETTVVTIAAVKEHFFNVLAKFDADEAQFILDVTTLSKKKNKTPRLGGQKLGVEFRQCEVDNFQNVITTALASDNNSAFLHCPALC